MRRALLTFIFTLVLAGCGSNPDNYVLPARWEPLRRVTRDPSVPSGVFINHGYFVATGSVRAFLDLSEVDRNGVLVHEQLHSIRREQDPRGSAYWGELYAVDRAFRWQEERLAWFRQIRYVLEHGERVDPGFCAAFLAAGYDGMVSLPEAQVWVGAAIRNEGP